MNHESFIGQRILDEIGDKLDKRQFGGLRGRSTNYALVAILHGWCEVLDDGQSVRTLSVDFQKAFDRIDHTLLFNKLLAYGAHNTMVKWLVSFLQGRIQRVKVGSCFFSEWREVVAGFPQGTWLGPLGFVVLTDDTTLTKIIIVRPTGSNA